MQFVPNKFHEAKLKSLELVIADMLVKIIQHNDNISNNQNNQQITRFHSRQAPSIQVPAYLSRIVQYASVEKACLLMILVYIDRIAKTRPEFILNSLTVHRFMIAAVTVTSKTLCDSYCTNTHYARVGGITVQELNTLELEFLFLINWHLYVDEETVERYYHQLTKTTLISIEPDDSETIDSYIILSK